MNLFAQNDLGGFVQVLDNNRHVWDYVQAGIIILVSIIIARILRAVLVRLVVRGGGQRFLGDLFGRLAGYLIVAVGLIYALEGLGIAVAPLLGALGIAGIAVAFALQDILENFVAGIILQLRRPFNFGDEIESGDHEGVVTGVDARTVTVRTPDGETVHIPSAAVIKNPIVNHTQHGMRRTTIDVGVAYGTDLAVATAVAVSAAGSVPEVHDVPPPAALIHTFGASSIDMAIRFWHDPSIAGHWTTRDAVATAVAAAFEEHGITIPFPQRVLHAAPEPPQQVDGFTRA